MPDRTVSTLTLLTGYESTMVVPENNSYVDYYFDSARLFFEEFKFVNIISIV